MVVMNKFTATTMTVVQTYLYMVPKNAAATGWQDTSLLLLARVPLFESLIDPGVEVIHHFLVVLQQLRPLQLERGGHHVVLRSGNPTSMYGSTAGS